MLYLPDVSRKGRILSDFVNQEADHTTVQGTVSQETEHSH